MGDLLGSGAAVDSPHGNAEGAGLQEVMVGQAFNQLDEAEAALVNVTTRGRMGRVETKTSRVKSHTSE